MPDLCTVADVRAFLQKQGTDVADDPILGTLITAASSAIAGLHDREFVQSSGTRRRRVTPPRNRDDLATIELGIYDLQSVNQLILGPTDPTPVTLDPSVYDMNDPDSLGMHSRIFISAAQPIIETSTWPTFGYSLVDINGTWGAAAIPDIVVQACVTTVAEWYRGKVTGFSTTFNQDTGKVEIPEGLPAAVSGWLKRYERYTA